MNNNDILIFVEITPNFKIAPVVFELASEGRKLAQKLGGVKLSAVIINDAVDYTKLNSQLSEAGFDKVYLIRNFCYKTYSTGLYTNALSELIKDLKPQIVLFGATRTGRDLAPRVSSRLNLGLTADCTSLDINENGLLAATRPTFGGQLMATILSRSETQMATVRPNVFKKSNIYNYNKEIEIEEKFYPSTHVIDNIEILNFIPLSNTNADNITEANVIVAGGMGMKNKEGFELLYELANLINGKVGATRAAVEAGFADSSIQIGQTGKTVTPTLYIACGISGAIQHIVGMSASQKIIAVNSDKNAPIFKHSDYGIVGDVFEVVPEIIKILKENK